MLKLARPNAFAAAKAAGALEPRAITENRMTLTRRMANDRVDIRNVLSATWPLATANKMRSERSRAMFERLKDCADRIKDQPGPHKPPPPSGSVDRHRALAPCAPGNPGNLQVRRAMGGGASSGAARLGTVSYCDQGTLLSRASVRRAPAAPGGPHPVAAAWGCSRRAVGGPRRPHHSAHPHR